MPEKIIVQDFKILAREVWAIFARCFAYRKDSAAQVRHQAKCGGLKKI
jgi:hypothetical protein